MAPSLLWTDTGELARLARFPSAPAPTAGVARFPTGMQPAPALPVNPELDPRKTPFVPVLNPALTPTRVAMPEIESARQQTLNSAAVQGASAPPGARPVTVWSANRQQPPAQPVAPRVAPAQPRVPPTRAVTPAQPPVLAAQVPARAALQHVPARPMPQAQPAAPLQDGPARPMPQGQPAAVPRAVLQADAPQSFLAVPRAQPFGAAPRAVPQAEAPTRAVPAVSRAPVVPPQPRSLADLASVPAQLKAEPRAAVPLTNSAAWQRPSFKSVELNVEGLDLEGVGAVQPSPSRSSAAMAAGIAGIAAIAEGIAHEPPPLPAPVEPRGLEGAFNQFLSQVMSSTGAAAAFVADADGLELANALATPELVAVSSLMGAHVDELRGVLRTEGDGALTFELDTDTLLQVLWADTALGRLAVGLVLSTALAPEPAREVRAGLAVAARSLKPESVF